MAELARRSGGAESTLLGFYVAGVLKFLIR